MHNTKHIMIHKTLALLLSLALILTGVFGGTFALIVTQTPSLINTFLSGLDPTGDLIICKEVSHPFGESYTFPDGLDFTFTVSLGEDYAGKRVETSQGELQADENGSITVTVTPGGRAAVYDIDEETLVTVTETQVGKGFTPDTVSQTLTIRKNQENLLSFTNTYQPEKADTSGLRVWGLKTLTGREWMAGDCFTFQLEVYENGAWTSLGTQSVTYTVPEKADFNCFDFSELLRAYPFDKAGTYSFRVCEVEGTISGITYDKAESRFDITVGDADMDGSLEIQDVTSASANTAVDGTSISIGFENSYAPAGSAEAYIQISKMLEDTSGQELSPAEFRFELYDETGELLLTSDPTNAAGQTAIRLVYAPADAGKTFTYILKETDSGQTVGAYVYDDTEYKLQVSVTDDLDGTVSAWIYDWQESAEMTDAALDENEGAVCEPAPVAEAEAATAAVPDGASDTYQAAFTNKYDPQDASVTIAGSKTLTGRALRAGEFTFELYQTGADFAVADGTQPEDAAVNDAGGEFHFDTLTFDRVGTYYYMVREDDTDALGGVRYDSTCYLVTIRVCDVGGVLTAKTTVTDGYGEDKDITFQNVYQAAPVSMRLDGRKVLKGAKLEEGAFRFLLYTADTAFHASGTVFQTATNDSSGGFSFAELTFTSAGVYRYVVMEEADAAEGMTYDDTVYCITVEVCDPGGGQLAIGQVTITADGKTVTDILFENTYAAPVKPEEPTETTQPEEPTVPEETTKPTEPAETVRPTVPKDPTSPQTGDERNILLWCVLMVLSAAVILVLMIGRRKRRKKG